MTHLTLPTDRPDTANNSHEHSLTNPLNRRFDRANSAAIRSLLVGTLLSLGAGPWATTQSTGQSHASKRPSSTADLAGQVATQSGAPLAGARAILENIETHQRVSAESGAQGEIRFVAVAPGEYRLQVSAIGYRTFRVPRIPLVAGDVAHANVQMAPGNASETVRGSSESVTSRVGTALGGKSVSDLPENQRNFVNLIQTSAGTNEGSTNDSASGSRPGAQHTSSAVSVGGQPETTNYSMIDGIDNNERINSEIALHPSVEGIDQVQVFANAYPAGFGHAGGGVINVVTKSGTDAFHGSLYEYFRNDLLDAYPYQFGAQNPKPELRQNQFGGSLGGPFLFGTTYFFADYEGFRLIQGRAPVRVTVPTAYEHAHPGDFSDVGGPVLHQFDSAGLAYFGLYPLPNVPGAPNQFVSAASGSNISHIGDLRIDHRFSQSDQFFSRFSYNRIYVTIPGVFPAVEEDGMTVQPGGSLTSFAGSLYDAAANTILDYVHQFSPRLQLDLRAGYTFWNESDTSLNPHVAVNQGFGQPGLNTPLSPTGLAPVNVVQASPLGTDGYYRPIVQVDNIFQYGGALGWTRSQHSMQLGAALIRRQWSDRGSSARLGMWTVQDLPSLLEGQFLQVQREVDLIVTHAQSWEPSAYIQDEWKLRPNLVLSLGLRYDVFTPPTEAHNQLSNFDPATGGIIIAGQDGVSRTAGVGTDYADAAPRFGLRWEAAPHTTLSGGFGNAYFRPIDPLVYKAPPFIYSFSVCSSSTCPGGYTTLAAGLPVPVASSAADPSGTLLGMRAAHYPSSYLEEFNLGVEQQLGHNTFRAYYVGALGRHLARNLPDVNAPPPNTSSDPDKLRPYYPIDPNLTWVTFTDTKGSSSYNALQVSAAHTSGHGLTANFNYTLAHGLDNVSGGGFGTVPSISSTLDYGNSSFDIRQRLAGTVFYNLPLGQTATGARALLLKSWQLNLSGIWSTGLPFTVLNANDVSNTDPGGFGADRPNQVGRGELSNPGVDHFFNTGAFVAQLPGTLGSESSNQLYGPHNRRIDASVFKSFALTREATLQFRTEVFNVTNTATFAPPAAYLAGANFGQLTDMTTGYTPREIQFALRVQF